MEHRSSIPTPRAVPAPSAPPATYDEEEEEEQAGEEEEEAPPPPARPPSDHRRSIPPPPRSVPVPPPPPPATYEAEQEEEQEEEAEEEAPPPPPPRPPSDHRRSIPPPPRSVPAPPALRSDEEETDSAYELDPSSPPLRTNRRSQPMMRVPPPAPQLEPEYEADEEEDTQGQQSEEEPVQVPPPLPAGRHVHGASPPVRSPPPPRLEDDYEQLETPEPEAFEHIAAPVPVPAPGARRAIPPVPGQEPESERAKPFRPSSIVTGGQAQARGSPLSANGSSGMLSPDSAAFEKRRQQEILEEDEGDPIDPAFHSPSRRGSTIDLEAAAAIREEQAQEAPAEPVEDPEAERRRTIAERMAKLGGIRFGAPPPIPRPRQRTSEDDQGTPAPATQEEEQPPQDEEEEERARKERIAAKLAGMGGIRMGMMPFGAGGPAQRAPPVRSEAASPPPPPPPMRVAPPPARAPPPPQEVDSEHESLTTNSEDGVRVEAEESEIEEIRHEDAEEEVPPPVPSRAGGHRTSMASPIVPSSPHIPSSRPPVPSAMPNRRASGQMASTPTSRKASAEAPPVPSANPRRTSTMNKQDFVMVDSDEPPPPPPARPSSRPPPRGVPPPPQDVAPSDSIDSMSSSQWELPSLSTGSIDFGGGIDTTFDVEATTSPPPPPKPAHPESSQQPPPPKATEVHYSSDDLVAIWGRVGVHLCEAATQLYEKSKKSLIGDGTYSGFVNAALHEVPNAARSSPATWGHLIYSQSGGSVQKRLSDIMPGDVVALFDAKLKGHKGLSTYSQTVGAGEPLVGIVSEFEAKKSKIRVFQANQHVGQQTVEAASYRLEDLKSGIVKVYRVLEA
ncbi:hypothetical protein R3P38DRAFT_2871394 [Favolaschia claudopus]|uniref:BBC1/AIM3 cysteine proteinase-fold domain-containing protein n=1 Tax=Favolaschia claudopus TaxID=2862362 RepID=A0AAW0DCA0_9AGAR